MGIPIVLSCKISVKHFLIICFVRTLFAISRLIPGCRPPWTRVPSFVSAPGRLLGNCTKLAWWWSTATCWGRHTGHAAKTDYTTVCGLAGRLPTTQHLHFQSQSYLRGDFAAPQFLSQLCWEWLPLPWLWCLVRRLCRAAASLLEEHTAGTARKQ